MNKELAPKLNLTIGELFSAYWSYNETVGYPINGDWITIDAACKIGKCSHAIH